MNREPGSLHIDKIDKIRLEAKEFREACAKSLKRSRELLEETSRLTGEHQKQIEESMVLKEEMVANKCEALSIMEHAITEREFHDNHPVPVNYHEELEMVEKLLAELDRISIPEENRSLQELRKAFLALSFVPCSG